MIRLLPIILLLVACSPERKLQRLLAKHPDLSRTDTIVVRDTVVVPGDTVRQVVTLHDTTVVESERQVIIIRRVPTGSPCDTAAIVLDVEGQVKTDTVYTVTEVVVDRLVPCPTPAYNWWRTIALVMGVLCLALFLLYRYPPHRHA